MSLVIEKLAHSYSSGSRVIDKFSLNVSGGCNVLIVGDNGSGKSTLGKILCGLLSPSEGQVYIRDQNIHVLGANKRIRYAYYVGQINRLQIVKSTLASEIKLSERTSANPFLEDTYSHFDLPQDLDTNPFELSVHQAWRFALLLSTVVNPELLFIDEIPSVVNKSNLDCLRFLLSTRSARGQITVLCYQREVDLMFDFRLVISEGKVIPHYVGNKGIAGPARLRNTTP